MKDKHSEHLVKTGIDLIVNEFVAHAYEENKLREGEGGGSTIDEQIESASIELKRLIESAYVDTFGRLTNGQYRQDLNEGRDDMFPNQWEHFGGDYTVVMAHDIEDIDVDQLPKLAYAVNNDSGEIVVGTTSPEEIAQTSGMSDIEGGWIFPRQHAVTLDDVTEKISVMYALSNALGISLRSRQQ